MNARGFLTEEIKAKSKELLGYEINTTELRMMPYLQYCLMNEQQLDPQKINDADRKIVSKWRNAGHIKGGISYHSLEITKEFWNIINEIIFMGYVDY